MSNAQANLSRSEHIAANFTGLPYKLNMMSYELESLYLERETEIPLMIATILSGQNCIFLGPPGTGKGGMIRAFTRRIQGMTLFETQCHPQAPADALLGPMSVKAYMESDRFEYATDGYLPQADIGFLDEIGQLSVDSFLALPSLLNPEERTLYMPGQGEIPTPLNSVFGASNELLPDELAKIWDRLTIRRVVQKLKDPANLFALVSGERQVEVTTKTTMTMDEFKQAQKEVAAVGMSREDFGTVVRLNQALESEGFEVSARTWNALTGDTDLGTNDKKTNLIKASAYFNGRDHITGEDFLILRNCFWNDPAESRKIERAIARVACPVQLQVIDLSDRADEIYNAAIGDVPLAKLNETRDELKKLQAAIDALEKTAETGKLARKLGRYRHATIKRIQHAKNAPIA